MNIGRSCLHLYNFTVSIPDRLYPFSEEIEGRRVRWHQAYKRAVERMHETYGYGHYGPGLIAYRGVFHLIGALLFILFASLVSRELFGSDVALIVLFILATIALAVQELYIQPRTFGQMRAHAVVDWLSWVVPFGVYLFMHFT